MPSVTAILLQLVMILAMWSPGFSPVMPSAALQAIEQQYQAELAERQNTIDALTKLEARHRGVISRITKLKGESVTLTNRLALDDLLRQSKQLSEEMSSLQATLRKVDGSINLQRQRLVDGLEKQMKAMEATLASSTAAERAKTVQKLNELRKLRADFEAPLPAAPSLGDLNAAITMAERVQDPEELLAAADELLDTEDQLRRRVLAIDQRLTELKQSKRLARRASSFAREERFFEETDRDRVIARYEKTTSTPGAQTPATDTPNSTPEASPSEPGELAAAADSQSGAYDGAPEVAGQPTVMDPTTDSQGTPVAAPNNSPDDLFTDTPQTVVINANADPSRSVGSASDGVKTGIDVQISALQSERERLAKQAAELRKQAAALKARAHTR